MEKERKAFWIYIIAVVFPMALLAALATSLEEPFILLIGFPIWLVMGTIVARKTIKKHPSPEMNDEMMLHIGGESAMLAMQITVTPVTMIGLTLFISESRWWPWAEPVGLALIATSMLYLIVYSVTYSIKVHKRSKE